MKCSFEQPWYLGWRIFGYDIVHCDRDEGGDWTDCRFEPQFCTFMCDEVAQGENCCIDCDYSPFVYVVEPGGILELSWAGDLFELSWEHCGECECDRNQNPQAGLYRASDSPPVTVRQESPPEPADIDGDGIANPDDACPAQPEVENGFADEDGCPDVVDRFPIEKYEIAKKIYFLHREHKIQQVSCQVLETVVEFLIAVPQIERVRIEGHRDRSEHEAMGSEISRRRAKAVRDYLVRHGVDSRRLEVTGTRDIQPAAPQQGYDQADLNRRVEFMIVSRTKE